MKTINFSNREIARILSNIAAAYTVKNDSRFRIMAYERAAVSVEHATSELKDLWDDDKLQQVPGIGKNISSYLDELFRTGEVRHFNRITKGLPPAMFIFLDIPGVGPKTAYVLAKSLKIIEEKSAIEKLKKAAKEGKIKDLENFGEKSQMDILEGINALQKGEMKTKRMLLPYADSLAADIIAYLKKAAKFLMVVGIVFLLIVVFLPRKSGGEGVRLVRTVSSQARIGSWQEALIVARDHPFLGVGFNTYRYAAKQYGFLSGDWEQSRAGAGVDSSLLFVLATTGVLGFTSYIWYWLVAIRRAAGKINSEISIIVLSSVGAILVHSFFLNSLFYPWSLGWLNIILGLL